MRLNIKFLQTGGVPLTNDVMDVIQEAYSIFNVLGDIAGHLTILSGCVVTGNTVSPGIVVINGDVLFFEGGLINSTVFINTEVINKTFQSQEYKALIENKTVRFGLSSQNNMWNWSDFVRLDTLKMMKEKIAGAALQTDLTSLTDRVKVLEKKTAPIINGGVVWAWFKPVSDIPEGWKEATDIRGKTIVGLDPDDSDFNMLKKKIGTKTHKLTISEMPNHNHSSYWTKGVGGASGSSGTLVDGWKETTSTGGDQPHNNIQPSIIALFIEPNFT